MAHESTPRPSWEWRDLPHASVHGLLHAMEICGKCRNAKGSASLHRFLARSGLETHHLLGNRLVWMLGSCGCMHAAEKVFDRLATKNISCFNYIVSGYVRHGNPQHAITMYEKMWRGDDNMCEQIWQDDGMRRTMRRGDGMCKRMWRDDDMWETMQKSNGTSKQMRRDASFCPNEYTSVALLMACAKLKDITRGMCMHIEAARLGFIEKDIAVANSLIDMYAKCGLLSRAKEVFDGIRGKNVVSWTALIGGYTQHGHGEEALKCFEEMQIQGVNGNARTFVCVLKACSLAGNCAKGEEIHALVERQGLVKGDIFIGSTLVDMYAKNGSLAKAREIFDSLRDPNAVSCNAILLAYIEHGYAEEALKFFETMLRGHVRPNAITFVCGLKACGSIGAIDKIGKMHYEIERKGLLEDSFVSNTLMDMYARCGAITEAQQIFDKLRVQDVISWTSLMSGYAQICDSENVFRIFDRMLGMGIKPDPVTFIIVLNTCSRTGLYSKGKSYFEAMSDEYGIIPINEHHACILDLLGRMGRLDKVLGLMKEMAVSPNVVMWHSLLCCCKKWGNLEFAKEAFQSAMHLVQDG